MPMFPTLALSSPLARAAAMGAGKSKKQLLV
jgi:hypothetical protein